MKQQAKRKEKEREEERVPLLKSGGTVVKTVEQFEVGWEGWCVGAVSIFFFFLFFPYEGTLDEG